MLEQMSGFDFVPDVVQDVVPDFVINTFHVKLSFMTFATLFTTLSQTACQTLTFLIMSNYLL